ncbi:hypothetical protein JRI60_33465 [Archangium violaceum]|uniref:DNA methyltransferase n=1 Tax=Archangium violaceum TaxID=83451 RepID=UPI00195104E5|nr:DNA methyltransferase [Archangium violaceum]QRN94037.1 hypothetical protein JRI60_33465 [Archangium violaceum]
MARRSSTRKVESSQMHLLSDESGASTSVPSASTVGPHPEVEAFVQAHRTGSDAPYASSAFEKDIETHKHNKLYTMHTYWSKKDPSAIAEYIKHYTQEGDLVLDPMCGSGTTGCAAVVSGRNALLFDVSPAACFLAYHYTLLPPPGAAKQSLDLLLGEGRGDRADAEFQTRCHRCGGDALIEYVLWSDQYQCPQCAKIVPIYSCPEKPVPQADGALKKARVCPGCLADNGGKPNRDFAVSTRSKKFPAVPVGTKVSCLGGCRPKAALRTVLDDDPKALAAVREDVRVATAARDARKAHPAFKMAFPKGLRYQRDALWNFGIETVGDFFTARNRAALSSLLEAPREAHVDPRLFLTWIVHKCSMLMGCNADGVGRVNKGTYYIAPLRMEARPTKYLSQAKSQILGHFEHKAAMAPSSPGHALISNEPAAQGLRRVPSSSVDYVFTDPPYTFKMQYGELNLFWEAMLGVKADWLVDEIVENESRGKSFDAWLSAIRVVFSEIHRVLKPRRCVSVCYHDTDPSTWTALQDVLLDVGFVIESVTTLEPRSKSQNANTAEVVVKSDLVLNCRKAGAEGENQPQAASEASVSDRVREILLGELGTRGGQTRDRLWDVVARRLLSRGQMAEHRFDDLLSEIAVRSESGRWFLKEQFESLSENDIKNEEKAGEALVQFARLRMMGVRSSLAAEVVLRRPDLAGDDCDETQVQRWIQDTLIQDKKQAGKFELGGRLKGVEFYDCLFFYLTRWLKARAAGKTPRRNLVDFLDEYLVRFKDGDKWLHRTPDAAEAQSLRKARQTGLGRRIRQYTAFLQGEGELPKERLPDAKTLVAWLKHCASFGLVEEGVAIYEKGGLIDQLGQLSEDERYDAEDYYAQCRRRSGKVAEDAGEDDAAGDDEGTDE